MNTNCDIDNLRFLLNKFYEAETSPEEENAIMSFFSNTEAEDMPQDLTVDRILFSSMKELLPYNYNLEIPDDLLNKINRNITNTSRMVSKRKKKITKKKWKNTFIYSGAAAIACIMLALGIRYVSVSSTLKHSAHDRMAETPSAPIEDSPSIISEPLKVVTARQPSEQNPPINIPEPLKSQTKAEFGVSPDEDDGYIEITDPEKVREIVLEIEKLLANNSQKTSEAIHMVENTVEDYKEITKSILQ